ncbi:MAG: hypothetical protein HYV09_15540 [Deltaproteobacteria bacterium]|nr:hypothetical protein [Deltaproteobacteria bacterium]
MRLARACAVVFVAIAPSAGAKANDPPPMVTVSAVTWTSAELTIQPATPDDSCTVRFGAATAGPSWIAVKPQQGRAGIVGLPPEADVAYSVSCEGSQPANGKFRTLPAPGALAPPPQVPTVIATRPEPGSVAINATYAVTGAAPTACWFEGSSKSTGPYLPETQEFRCSGSPGHMGYRFSDTGAARWVRFALRNAGGKVSSAAIRVPP